MSHVLCQITCSRAVVLVPALQARRQNCSVDNATDPIGISTETKFDPVLQTNCLLRTKNMTF